MIVIRTVCPTCSSESKRMLDKDNIRSYEERVNVVRCANHPVTPEERLLAAIFGEKLR